MSLPRDLRFDGLKSLLIFLVVLGHLTFKDYGVNLMEMIYSFHMPVFVFLSGYFTSLSSDKEKQRRWLKKTLIIFIVALIAQYILKLVLEYELSQLNGFEFSAYSILKPRSLVSPGFALWYLVCLMYWRIAVWRLGDALNDRLLIILSCVAAILAGFIPLDNEFAFQRAFAFSPFFFIGLLFKKKRLVFQLERIPIGVAVMGIIVGLLIAREMPLYEPSRHYLACKDLILRLIQTILGLWLCLMVVRVSRCQFTKYFAWFGTKTLWIYVGHTYLIIFGRRFYPYWGISFNLFSAIIVAVLYCALIILIANSYESIRNKRSSLSTSQNT